MNTVGLSILIRTETFQKTPKFRTTTHRRFDSARTELLDLSLRQTSRLINRVLPEAGDHHPDREEAHPRLLRETPEGHPGEGQNLNRLRHTTGTQGGKVKDLAKENLLKEKRMMMIRGTEKWEESGRRQVTLPRSKDQKAPGQDQRKKETTKSSTIPRKVIREEVRLAAHQLLRETIKELVWSSQLQTPGPRQGGHRGRRSERRSMGQ